MKKSSWFAVIAVVAAIGFWSSKLLVKKPAGDKSPLVKVEGAGYWTCPMHPQIHSDKPGECPICHMKLVKVKAKAVGESREKEAEARAPVAATSEQLTLMGVQKVQVEKMNLISRIPISGRLISPGAVAFQVYESDVRYLRPGLTFRAESSLLPETDIEGVLSSVDTIVDPTSRTVRAVGQIRKGPRGLIAETTFRGEIQIALKDVVAIPESSVLQTGAGALVYGIGDDGVLTAKSVRLGQKTESYYEVLEGLRPGEWVSSGPNFLIDSEAKIRGVGGGESGHAHH